MAKKKEIKLTRSAGETVESGDVNFSYNNVLIGSLSDTGSAVLKTENTVVKHDIEVEYTKPETIRNVPVSVTINSEDNVEIISSSPIRGYFITQNGIATTSVKHAKMVYPYFDGRDEEFIVTCVISSDTDKYDVTLNGNAVTYSNQQYLITKVGSAYPTEFNIVVSDKSAQ